MRDYDALATLLHSPGGEAGDDLALDDDRQDEHRQHDDERRGGKRSPRKLLEGEDVVDGDWQGPRLAAGKDDAEDEIVPREDDRENPFGIESR